MDDYEGFGTAPIKKEGYTLNLETGESYPTPEHTDIDRARLEVWSNSWLEICYDPDETRETIHAIVDGWLNRCEEAALKLEQLLQRQ